MQAAVKNINLNVVHILGKNNVNADLMSRWEITANLQGKLNQLLPNHIKIKVQPSDLDIDWSI